MPPSMLAPIIDAFAGLEVVVVGEAMLDTYLDGTSSRLCREAPVPIVRVTRRNDAAGAAANTAVNARALGARVRFLCVVGDDDEGSRVRACLEAAGLDTEDVLVDPARRTLAKGRILASGQMLLRADQGTETAISPATERKLIERLEARVRRAHAVAISDYGYGILTPRVLGALARLQEHAPRVMVADSKYLPAYRDVGLTAVKPNYDEAVQLLGGTDEGGERADRIAAHAHTILQLTGARIAAITLDAEGAIVVERNRPPYRTYAQPARHSQAAGAGERAARTSDRAAGCVPPRSRPPRRA